MKFLHYGKYSKVFDKFYPMKSLYKPLLNIKRLIRGKLKFYWNLHFLRNPDKAKHCFTECLCYLKIFRTLELQRYLVNSFVKDAAF